MRSLLTLCLLSLVCYGKPPAPSQVIGASEIYFPVVVYSPGLNNTTYKTRVTVLNPDPSMAQVRAIYVQDGQLESRGFVLSGGETRTFENLFGELFGGYRTGGLILESTSPHMMASGEVWTDGPGGRYSTSIPALNKDEFHASTFWDWTLGVRVDAKTRANIACVNFGNTPVVISAKLFDAPGNLIKEFTFNLTGHQWEQKPVDIAVNGGTMLWVTQLGLSTLNYCYGVNVDNTSNDGTFLGRVLYLPGGY